MKWNEIAWNWEAKPPKKQSLPIKMIYAIPFAIYAFYVLAI